jgi:hypothetical protein
MTEERRHFVLVVHGSETLSLCSGAQSFRASIMWAISCLYLNPEDFHNVPSFQNSYVEEF